MERAIDNRRAIRFVAALALGAVGGCDGGSDYHGCNVDAEALPDGRWPEPYNSGLPGPGCERFHCSPGATCGPLHPPDTTV